MICTGEGESGVAILGLNLGVDPVGLALRTALEELAVGAGEKRLSRSFKAENADFVHF